MQISQNEMPDDSNNHQTKKTENQKIEEICHQLKDICTVSYSLIFPQCVYKRIKKRKVLKYIKKHSDSEEQSTEYCKKYDIPTQKNSNSSELEEKIAVIDDLQLQIKQLKAILGGFEQL